jgi:hypothetical protein
MDTNDKQKNLSWLDLYCELENATEAEFTNALRNCDLVEFPELNETEADFTNAFRNCVLYPDCNCDYDLDA